MAAVSLDADPMADAPKPTMQQIEATSRASACQCLHAGILKR